MTVHAPLGLTEAVGKAAFLNYVETHFKVTFGRKVFTSPR